MDRKEINPELRFLADRSVVYYAGLDVKGFPFEEAKRKIYNRALLNLTYLKTLSLFVDHIVVPPTFYIDYIDMITDYNITNNIVRYLIPLYSSNLVLSAVYKGMSSPADFLEFKTKTLNVYLSKTALSILTDFFQQMPLFHRDAEYESNNFRNRVISAISSSKYIDDQIKLQVFSKINSIEGYFGIPLSREKALECLYQLLKEGKISRKHYRKLFYAINSCYYLEGAETYFANISILESHRYSVFGSDLFTGHHRKILVAYDPELLLAILKGYGISEHYIDRLKIEDILLIKRSTEYQKFLTIFRSFAEKIQSVIEISHRLSQKKLQQLKNQIQQEFHAEYVAGRRLIEQHRFLWGLAETAIWSVLTGIVGFFLTPLYGALLQVIPPILYATRVTPRLSDFIIGRIQAGQKAFYNYVELLSQIITRITSNIRNEKSIYHHVG